MRLTSSYNMKLIGDLKNAERILHPNEVWVE